MTFSQAFPVFVELDGFEEYRTGIFVFHKECVCIVFRIKTDFPCLAVQIKGKIYTGVIVGAITQEAFKKEKKSTLILLYLVLVCNFMRAHFFTLFSR